MLRCDDTDGVHTQELLRTPLYASALEKSLPKVVSTAASVLEGVKRRGREQGDVMDAATEEALKPQVRRKLSVSAQAGEAYVRFRPAWERWQG